MIKKIVVVLGCLLLLLPMISVMGISNLKQASVEEYNDSIKYPSHKYPNISQTDITIIIEPYNPPIIIPDTGGTFTYAIEVTNNEPTSLTFEIWTRFIYPDGTSSDPIFGPESFQLPGGWSANQDDLSANVASWMPSGMYTYTAYAGMYPNQIWSSNNFAFEKLSGGDGWYAQVPGMDRTLMGISFSDTENGWAVGDYHSIIHTTNGGDTWYPQDDGQYYIQDYNDVYFINDEIGWVIGSLILHTTDGGTTWTEQYDPTTGLYRGFFIDSNNGWVVGGEVDYYNGDFIRIILHTSNGGDTWETQLYESDYYYNIGPLNDIYFIDINHGWAVGDKGAVFYTSDGGVNWIEKTSGTYMELFGVTFTDLNNGWAVGEEGTVLTTTNGGNNWNTVDIGTTDELNSIVFTDANNGWIAGGDYYPLHGTIFHTEDGGTTWNLQDTGTGDLEFMLNDICFVDDTQGWAAGGTVYSWEAVILHTENGGGPSVEPILSFTPSSIDFGDMYNSQTDTTEVTLWNSGTGTLSYFLSPDCTWITADPEEGFSSGEQDTIVITIDTGGLQPGEYHCDITIYSNGGTNILSVDVTIIEANQILTFSPTSYDFGDMGQNQMATMNLSIWNSGTGTMYYWIDDSGTFCIVEPWSGSSQGEVNTHIVRCFTSPLDPGPHQCNLIIHSSGGTGIFTVYVNVVP